MLHNILFEQLEKFDDVDVCDNLGQLGPPQQCCQAVEVVDYLEKVHPDAADDHWDHSFRIEKWRN